MRHRKQQRESVLRQGCQDIQLIVVEDGSDSGIRNWLLGRAEYVQHEENRGLGAARNTGLEMARAPFVSFLDDDDEWLPDTSRTRN